MKLIDNFPIIYYHITSIRNMVTDMATPRKLKNLTLPVAQRMLAEHGNNVAATARALNVTKQAMYYWMRVNGCRIVPTFECAAEPKTAART